jgi:subtilisin family serine protease
MKFKMLKSVVLLGAVLLPIQALAFTSWIVGTRNGSFSDFESRLHGLQLKATRQYRTIDAVVVQSIQDYSREQMGQLLKNEDTWVRYFEPNYRVKADQRIPNDSKFDEQYSLSNVGQSGGRAGVDIGATHAWQESTGDRRIKVAIIDTGVDLEQPDLKENLWVNPGEYGLDERGQDKSSNNIDDDQNGFVDDYHGWNFVDNNNIPQDDNGHSHGTHCAGVIGAVGNNGQGIAGINWDVSIVPVKFLDAGGGGSLSNAIAAIDYANIVGVDVMNNSWGGGDPSVALGEVIQAAADRNIIFVASAGNESTNNDRFMHVPSGYKMWNVISVAATDHNDQLASFSNYGAKSVHIAAPGVDILSTLKANSYGKLSGTSMAAPHISGAFALLKAGYPHLSSQKLIERLMVSVTRIPSLNGRTSGGGRLNLGSAMENDLQAPSAAQVLGILRKTEDSLSVRVQAAGDDGAAGWATGYQARYAAQPIETEADWNQATVVVAVEDKTQRDLANHQSTLTLKGFLWNSKGYLAVRAFDNIRNVGTISPSFSFSTQQTHILGLYLPRQSEGLQLEGLWGVQSDVEGQELVFADSPEGEYSANVSAAINLPTMERSTDGTKLIFDSFTDLERGYDFGRVEIRVSAGSWQVMRELTDRRSWRTIRLDIDPYVPLGSSFQLRFRMTSDHSLEQDGWFLNRIAVIAPLSLKR